MDQVAPSDRSIWEVSFFFSARTEVLGRELWRSDGTAAGTVLVKDVNPGVASGLLDLFPNLLMETSNGLLFFTGVDTSGGRELWRSDGTEDGTYRVKDIYPGAANSNPRELFDCGSSVLFRTNDGVTGEELWTSDGSSVGTIRLIDINPGAGSASPQYLTNVSKTVFFSALEPSSGRG